MRTLQEFLQFFKWDHARINAMVQHRVMDARAPGGAPGSGAIGVLDPSGHAKRGDKTPGVQRQWCGETGKIDNCVVGQHLLYTDNDANNPFTCVLASDLYLPQSWAEDRERCRAAGIGDDIVYRPKWRIAADQVREALGNGVRFAWLTFDEEFGSVPAFWFALDALGQRAIGEVKPNFYAWAKKPACHSLRSEHAARRVDNLCRQSPVFTGQKWREMTIKDNTRGPIKWAIKAARVHLVERDEEDNSQPTDRQYGLIIARKVSDDGEGEIKYSCATAAPVIRCKKCCRPRLPAGTLKNGSSAPNRKRASALSRCATIRV